MHIEVGLVSEAKMVLSYGTALAAFGYLGKQLWTEIKGGQLLSLGLKSLLSGLFVLMFFEVFPHHPIGVSEVHLILGSTLFLLFGLAPAGMGLALGLLLQGLFFAPFDLPNYSLNVTTLLAPLFVMAILAKRLIPANIAYKDLAYTQVLKLSLAYQGGIVTWVAFWALYGQGMVSSNLVAISLFAVAYMSVVLLEPLINLVILASAKSFTNLKNSRLFTERLYHS